MVQGRVIALVLLAACSGAGTASTGADPTGDATLPSIPEGPLLGLTFSPLAFDQEGIDGFFEAASESADAVAWLGPWDDIDSGGTLVYEQARQRDMVPVIVAGLRSDESGRRVLPDDAEDVAARLAGWVEEHPVHYLGFGVETDTHLSPDDFERYAEIFGVVAQSVHKISPETIVFPGFQLERLQGLRGGLYGEEDTEPRWDLLQMFPEADAVGFSSYPGLIYPTPSAVPSGYYASAAEEAGLPVVITELGWQAGGDLGEWSGSPDEQAEFVRDVVPGLAREAQVTIWSFLFDQAAAPPPFDSMGLADSNGDARPTLEAWEGLR